MSYPMPYHDDLSFLMKKKEEVPEVKIADLKITTDGKIVNKDEVVKDELYNRYTTKGVMTNREYKLPLASSSPIPNLMKELIKK